MGQWRPLRRKLRAGKQLGDGTEKWNGGNCYTGTWHNNVTQGEGIYFYANSNRFEGSFANDQLHGEGTYHHTNGNLYVWPWRENKRQRLGVCLDAEGNAVRAEFRGGLRAS